MIKRREHEKKKTKSKKHFLLDFDRFPLRILVAAEHPDRRLSLRVCFPLPNVSFAKKKKND